MGELMELKKLRALRVWLEAEKIHIMEALARGQDTQWLNGFDCAITRVQNKMTELEL